MKQIRDYSGKGIVLFLSFYFLLYIFPFPFDSLPFQIGKSFSSLINVFWQRLVLFFAKDLLEFSGKITPNINGSGDSIYYYFKLILQVIIALVISIIWLTVNGKCLFYNRIKPFLLIYFRYFLAFTLLSYGLAKVFPNQFWEPGLTDLLKPFGDISPMGLLWKFMGYSISYIVFTGILEVLACILLLFRNTLKLGGILSFGILLNIFALNMSYDVPVKLFSLHLLILSIIVLAPYFRDIVNFFVFNKTTKTHKIYPYFKTKKYRRIGYFFKSLIIIFLFSTIIVSNYTNQFEYGRKSQLPPLYGIYEVENFIINNDTLAPLLTDKTRWRRLTVDKFNVNVTKMNGDILYTANEIDTQNLSIKLKPFKEDSSYQFNYILKDSSLILVGTRDRDSLKIDFKVKDHNDFYLMKRGFYWINEYPDNR